IKLPNRALGFYAGFLSPKLRVVISGLRRESLVQTEKPKRNPKARANLAIALVVLLLPSSHLASAQQSPKVPRIGYVAQRNPPTSTTPDPAADAFYQGLRDLGYIDGQTIQLEYRYAGGSEDRLRALVADLVQLKVDVIVSPTFQGIRAAKETTKTIPVVMV